MNLNHQSSSAAPAISVILPVFNRGYCLGATLQSVLAQTFTDFEVIVVDDGSTDDTVAVARSFGGRVQVLTQANRGASAARNAGIRQARGQWLAFQDSDDFWHPKKLERQMAVLQKNGGRWCATTTVDAAGKIICDHRQVSATTLEPAVYFVRDAADFVVAVVGTHPYLQSMILEKALAEQAGLFAEELFAAEDTEFIFRLAQLSGVYFVDEPLTLISQHNDDSLTRNRNPQIRERRFDAYALSQEKIHAQLVAQKSPHQKAVRERIAYLNLSRAELACVAGDFARARALAAKGLSGGAMREKLRCVAIWCWPARWQKFYQKKWEGQHV